MNDAAPLSPIGVKVDAAIRRAAAIQRRLDELEEEVETLTHEHQTLVRHDLPDLLAEAGTSVWETDAASAKLVGKVQGTFKNSTDPEKGVAYLRDADSGLPIKTVLTVEFSEAERAICVALAEQIKKSLDKDASSDRVIHPQTLAAWARERLRSGEPVDFKLLGLVTWREVALTLKGEEDHGDQ